MSDERAVTITISIDGTPIVVPDGMPIGAALHSRRAALRRTGRRGEPRGLFCGMGLCFDCLVTVDGRPDIRACITPAADGMRVETTVR